MATQSTYYLNASTLAAATAVFTDANLTTCAPDGYYREGNIVRELVGCVLLPQQLCPACVDSCGDGVIELSGSPGVYNIPIDTGSSVGDVGAVIIKFDPLTAPDGIQVTYDGVIYNELSSPTYGYLTGDPNLPVYIGDSGSDCGLVIDSPHVLDVYNYYSGTFQSPTTTETVSIVGTQLDFTVTSPGECVMVIPKLVGVPSIVNIKIVSVCPFNDFTLRVACPEALPSFPSSEMADAKESACVTIQEQTYYSAPVTGDGTTLGLYDWVFFDQNGENVLLNGWYQSNSCPAPNDVFRVANGVIVEFDTCP
jgi:hypothetical protein